MIFSVSVFRTQFPEFADTEVYTTSDINLWATIAQAQVDVCRWKTLWLTGVSLYVAHEITISVKNKQIANFQGTPGTFGGIANTKTVGSGTIGFDSSTSTEKDAGYWNLTTYGKKYIHLARMFGVGAVQL